MTHLLTTDVLHVEPVHPGPSLTERLLGEETERSALSLDARRLLSGCALAACVGAAAATREGLLPAIANAGATSGWLLGSALVGLPSLAIILPLLGARVELRQLVRCISRAAAAAGLVMCGLAPAVMLFSVTSSRGATAMIAASAMALAGLVGLRSFGRALAVVMAGEPTTTRHAAWGVLTAFVVFELVFAVRFAHALLPAPFGAS